MLADRISFLQAPSWWEPDFWIAALRESGCYLNGGRYFSEPYFDSIDPKVTSDRPAGCVRLGILGDGRCGEAQPPPQRANSVAGDRRHMRGMLRSTQVWSARRV